ncbi:MAG: hypothetical protein ACI35W_06935 [Anaeroplasmataceae bacterium]
MDYDYTEEIYYDKLNREIRISKPNNPSLIKGGKEGSIYDVVSYKNIKYNANNLLLKCFDRATDPYEKYEKITDMIRRNEGSAYVRYYNNISDTVAFPLEAVYRGENRRDFVGFLMRKMNGNMNFKEYTRNANHTYYNYNSCVAVANSLCKIVYNIHRMGYVIGDFNDLNIIVDSKTNSVSLVDADSFIFNKYTIEIGRPEMLPKEIVERQKRISETKENVNITYNEDTDDYALAVHIYKLFTGCYPYIHKNKMEDPKDDSSIAYAVLNDRFPLINPVCLQPSHFFPLKAIPKEVSTLLAKAFSGTKRPNAAAYMAALAKVKNKQKKCSRDDKHIYYKELGRCPCCEYAKANGLYVKENSATVTKPKKPEKYKPKTKSRFNIMTLLVIIFKIIMFLIPFAAIGATLYFVGPAKALSMVYFFPKEEWYFYLIEAVVPLVLLIIGIYAVSHTGEFSSRKEKVMSCVFALVAYLSVAFICLVALKRPIIKDISFGGVYEVNSITYPTNSGRADVNLTLNSSIANEKYIFEDLEIILPSSDVTYEFDENDRRILHFVFHENGYYTIKFKSRSQNKILNVINFKN